MDKKDFLATTTKRAAIKKAARRVLLPNFRAAGEALAMFLSRKRQVLMIILELDEQYKSLTVEERKIFHLIELGEWSDAQDGEEKLDMVVNHIRLGRANKLQYYDEIIGWESAEEAGRKLQVLITCHDGHDHIKKFLREIGISI